MVIVHSKGELNKYTGGGDLCPNEVFSKLDLAWDKGIKEILEIVLGLIGVIFLWGNVWMHLCDEA